MNDDVLIEHLIAHNVDHHTLQQPKLSEREPPFDAEVASFFARHVREARKHQRNQESIFSNGQAVIQDLCYDILKDPKRKLVDSSQQIAEHLFASMLRLASEGKGGKVDKPLKPDLRISKGELVVCTFRDGRSGDPWVALLKMDPAEGFASEPQTIEGQFCFVFRHVGDIMPTGELQKCAFVLPPALGKERRIDLLVLDQQVGMYGGYRMASSFFTERFLHCAPVLQAAEKNLAFILGSQNFADTREWPPQIQSEFHQGIALTARQPKIDVAHFGDTYIPEEERDEYLDFLRSKHGLTQFVFPRDPEVTEKLTRYEEFVGDAGLRLVVESGKVGRDQMVSPEFDEATGEWVVTIRTTQWKAKFARTRR